MTELLLLRHAKSDWDSGVRIDHARPLNARGRAAAPRMGRYLLEQDWLPDRILCSTAQRTRETLQLLWAAWPRQPDVTFLDAIYEATATDLLQVLRDHTSTAQRLLLIGHNPGLEALLRTLTGAGEASMALPTCALVRLQLHPTYPWQPGQARLLHVQRVRELHP